jgi:membrane-associated phospholipid phosphatase
MMTGGLLGGTGLTMLVDEDIRELFGRGHDSIRDRIAIIGNTMGTLLPGGILVGSLYIGGLVFDEPSVRLAGRHAGQALLYAGAINGFLKVVIGRHRPSLNDGAFTFRGPTLEDRYQSLPSGHTTIAFALASSLAADIDNPWATVGLYGLATITALSRIYDDRHWGSDVFLAAGISAACGYAVVHLHDVADASQGSFYLVPGPTGLTAGWRF